MAKNKNAKKLQKEAAKAAKTTKVETPATVETKVEKPESAKPTETKPVEEKPVEAKPEEAKPTETKPAAEPTPEKPEKEQKPVDTKPEPPQEPKEGKKRGRPRIPVLTPEEVTEEKKNIEGLSSISMESLSKGDRIDKNHTIDLMKMLHTEYVTNPDAPEELRKAVKTEFDIMAFTSIIHWNTQTREDFGNAGIKVSAEMFDAMSRTLADSLGITLRGLPQKDGQMEIDFDASLKDAPEDTKQAIAEEKKIKPAEEIPEWNEKKTDADVIKDLKSIMSMKNGMEHNLYNAVEYARKAYGMEKVEPAYVIATILAQLPVPHVLLSSFKGMAFGSLVKSEAPFMSHCRFFSKFRQFKYTEKEVANIVKMFIAYAINLNAKENEKDEKQNLEAYSNLLHAYNDNIVKQILNASKDSNVKVELPEIKGLMMNKTFNAQPIVKLIKETYGDSLSDKLVKQKMSEIAFLYSDSPIDQLATYQEKAYDKVPK